MGIWEALFLGIIQGLTEFLPVSSSGHLVLGGILMGLKDSHLLFDVVVHAATLVATLYFYRDTVLGIVRDVVSPQELPLWKRKDGRLMLLVLCASIPTAIIGLGFKDTLEALFLEPKLAAAMLLVTAGVLLATKFVKAGERDIQALGIGDALLLGLVQGMAIIPGISRSGSTISTAMFLKVDRELAARFSFLMSVPAISGALLLQLKKAVEHGGEIPVLPLALGFVSACIMGLVALFFLVPVVRSGRFFGFAFYLIPAGLLGLWLL